MTTEEATQLKRMIGTYASLEAAAGAAYACDQETTAQLNGQKAEAKLTEIHAFIAQHTKD